MRPGQRRPAPAARRCAAHARAPQESVHRHATVAHISDDLRAARRSAHLAGKRGTSSRNAPRSAAHDVHALCGQRMSFTAAPTLPTGVTTTQKLCAGVAARRIVKTSGGIARDAPRSRQRTRLVCGVCTLASRDADLPAFVTSVLTVSGAHSQRACAWSAGRTLAVLSRNPGHAAHATQPLTLTTAVFGACR